MHYILKVSRNANLIHIGMNIVLTYIERFFQYLAAFVAIYGGH